MWPATLLKKRLRHRYFSVHFTKFLRTPFFTEHLQAARRCLATRDQIWIWCLGHFIFSYFSSRLFRYLPFPLFHWMSVHTIVSGEAGVISLEQALNHNQQAITSQDSTFYDHFFFSCEKKKLGWWRVLYLT